MFHALQLKPAIGYDGSNANEADALAFRPAADELGEYKVEDISAMVGMCNFFVVLQAL